MAQKRMFDKAITNSDSFLELTDACQNLYFHLSMNADDDGFVDNWKSILRMTNHKPSDMQELANASFIIPFESGVIVIRHWRMNNYLRNDRYKETTHKFEKSLLRIGENEEYFLASENLGIPMVDTDKNSIEKNSIEYKEKDNNNKLLLSKKKENFCIPTLEEVKQYCEERNNNVDAEQFINFYESKGWFVGKTKMKNWKAAVRTWEGNSNQQKKKTREQEFQEQLERMRKLDEEEERLKNEEARNSKII